MTVFADPMCDVLDSLTNPKNKSYIPISGTFFRHLCVLTALGRPQMVMMEINCNMNKAGHFIQISALVSREPLLLILFIAPISKSKYLFESILKAK